MYFHISAELSEEEKNLPLHKISVIDEGEQRPVSTKRTGNLNYVLSVIMSRSFSLIP